MSIASDKIWEAVRTKDYVEIQKTITEHPEENLVNVISSRGMSLLNHIMMKNPIPLDLVRFITAHPTFDLHFQKPNTQKAQITNLTLILQTGSIELFKMIESLPGVIGIGEEISFAFVERTMKYASSIKDFQEILTILRNKTIIEAITTDNPVLLEKLEAAGDVIRNPLSDGSTPLLDLVEANNPNIAAWLVAQYLKPSSSGSSLIDLSFFHKIAGGIAADETQRAAHIAVNVKSIAGFSTEKIEIERTYLEQAKEIASTYPR